MFETLSTANEYMNNLEKGVNIIVESIREKNTKKAVDTIVLFCNGVDWLMEAVELTNEIQKEEISFQSLNEKLEETVEALENDDYNLVGDLFNYEIKEILEEIHSKIKVSVAN